MRNDIRLFLAEKEIEFNADPKILLNYKETELHNPTIVRNSFTKQITVEGTSRNNDVFGNIWDLTRIQEGMDFNPIYKTDFQLFVNDELFQTGYAKLDKVTKKNNGIQYALTLYGGLGQFFFNLSYGQDSDVKKTLADLKYTTQNGEPHPDLDFNINKDAVHDAWQQINKEVPSIDGRWDVINFIPAYEGIPDNFSADKVLINNYGLPEGVFRHADTSDGTRYSAVLNGVPNDSGYSLGQASEEMTEWETFDLRSYNQRPVISMYRVIQACCDPANNGGYEVDLDDHFFHYNNPYYMNAWMTLPKITDIDRENVESESVTGVTLTKSGTSYYRVNYTTTGFTSLNNVKMRVAVNFNPTGSSNAQNLYTRRDWESKNVITFDPGTYVKRFRYNTGVILRLDAYDPQGTLVGRSKTYLLATEKYYPGGDTPLWQDFDPDGKEEDYIFMQGNWQLSGGSYVFVDTNGVRTDLDFTFATDTEIGSLVFRVMTNAGYKTKYFFSGSAEWRLKQGDADEKVKLWTSRNYSTTGRHETAEVYAQDAVEGRFGLSVVEFDAIAHNYDSMFSNTLVTADKLLAGEHTPAEYLLDYCKLFGLYFYHDPTEESENPERYPMGVVHIMDRDSFYTEEVVDLSKKIDYSRDAVITPAMASSKWYRFDLDQVESEAQNEYHNTYQKNYGSQTINTNYNFDNNTTDLYKGSVFKGAINVWEKDKYFKMPTQGVPNYAFNGLTYNLYAQTGDDMQALEEKQTVQTTAGWLDLNALGYEYYDAFPKVQLHDKDNSNVDGDGVLVFYRGPVTGRGYYNITDDVYDMVVLNDASPCWIMTNEEFNRTGDRIAYKTRTLPQFTRDLVYLGLTGSIVHSWNFGHPRVTYAPDTYTTEYDSIYDVCWRDYIKDLYSVDTRKLTCYVKAEMDGRPWPYWFRRFYWFENSIWVLNEIKDLQVGGFDTTKMEFIKVQDMDNYKLDQITWQGHNQLVFDQATVPCTSGYVTGTMYMQGGGGWAAGDFISGVDGQGNHYYLDTSVAMNPYRGDGAATSFVITLSANTAATPITWSLGVEDDYDKWYWADFTQESCGVVSYLTVSPSAQTTSAGAMNLVTYTIEHSSDVTDIGAYDNAEWTDISVTGDTLRVVTDPNTASTTTQPRSSVITVSGNSTAGTLTAQTTINQEGREVGATLSISPTARTMSSGLTESYFVITYTGIDETSLTASFNGAWITSHDWEDGVPGRKYLRFYFAANTGAARTAGVTVTATATTGGTKTVTASISQERGTGSGVLAISPSNRLISASTTYTYFTYSTTGSVTNLGVTTNSPSWLSPSIVGNNIDVTVSANTGTSVREGTITITGQTNGTTLSATATIHQYGTMGRIIIEGSTAKTIASTATGVDFRYHLEGEVTNLGVSTNKSWATAYLSYPYITVYTDENTGSTARTVEITVTGTSQGQTTSARCYVEQKPPQPGEITISPSTAYIKNTGTTATFTISTSGPEVTNIGVSDNVSWATVSRNGNNITVTVTQHTATTNSDRTGTLTVTGTSEGQTVSSTATFTQYSSYMLLSPSVQTFGYNSNESENMTVTVRGTNDWRIINIIDKE